jgi:hAT family C-terminal dimerisation region
MASIMKDMIIRFHDLPEEGQDNQDHNDIIELGQTQATNAQHSKRKPKTALEIELEEALQKASTSTHCEKSQPARNLLSTIKKEISLFQSGGSRGLHLQIIYDSLKTIPPTSVEPERAFSAAGFLVSKVRARLNDCTIDNLCFLRSYYQMLEYQAEKNGRTAKQN